LTSTHCRTMHRICASLVADPASALTAVTNSGKTQPCVRVCRRKSSIRRRVNAAALCAGTATSQNGEVAGASASGPDVDREAAIGGGGRPIVLFARRRRRRRWSLTAAAKPLLKVIRLPLMQCKLTGIRDSPTLCHSSSACPVNLRCISTAPRYEDDEEVV
jgi:hypothetical protein